MRPPRLRCRYSVVLRGPGLVVIRDDGHALGFATVTNDADEVVRVMTAEGLIGPGVRLEYLDSEGDRDEMRHDGAGGFLGYAPARPAGG